MKLLLILIPFLAACTPTSTFYGIPLASENERLEHFQAKCEAYGFETGTTEMSQCIQELDSNWKQSVQDSNNRRRSQTSYVCKDAMARGDEVAIRTHC